MAELEHTELVAGGIRTRVIDTGPQGAREAVVFVHGAPGSAEAWTHLQTAVGEFGRAVAFDLPGYGLADAPRDFPHSVSAYADFIGLIIAAMKIERAHLVMNDIGGSALAWAVKNPAAFASSVQIDTGIINQMRAWHLVGRLFRTPVIGALAELFGHVALAPVIGYFDVVPKDVRRKWAADFDRRQRRALRRMYRVNPVDIGTALIPQLAALDRPALVIWGGRDRFVPVQQADQRAAFPRARVEILPASGHYPHLDDPQRVESLVVPFLRQQMHTRPVRDAAATGG